jgi:hypothetical protein
MLTMRDRWRRGLALALIALLAGAARAAAPPAKGEDDPLPRHARLRLGLARFRVPNRHPIVALSPDGKALAMTERDTVILCEFPTGKRKWRLTLPDLWCGRLAFWLRRTARCW